MIIKELNLIGFGKFKNKVIKLDNGINLIYGKNEDGKSTLHSFIDGMFYGFLRPNVKSTLFTEEYNKYEPWNSSRYAGIIKLEYNNNDYRIERNFTKNKEETKVLIENTGQDITYKIDNGSNSRVLQPGIHFLGLNSIEYSNTVSIKQLGSRINDNLANEVRDKLVNISTSFDEDISIKNALDELDILIKEIGTERASTSFYGKLCDELNNLINQKELIDNDKFEYEELLDENMRLKNRIELAQKKLLEDQNLLAIVLNYEKKEKYNEALKINSSIGELQKIIGKLEKYKGLSYDNYKFAQIKSNEINIITSRIEDLRVQIKDIENTINSSMFLTSSVKTMKDKQNSYKTTISILVGLYIVLMFLSISKNVLSLIAIIQLLLIPIIILSFRMNQGIHQYNFIKEEKERIFNENKIRVNTLRDRIDKLILSKEKLNEELSAILRSNDASSLEEFESNLENKKSYDDVLKEYYRMKELLIKILENNSLADLEAGIIKNTGFEAINVEQKQSIQERIERYSLDITELRINKRGIEERLKLLNPRVSKLIDVEENINRYQDEIFKLDNKRKSLELAKSTIIELSKNIQNQFVPQINNQVGKLLKRITKNKYSGVRISNKLDIDILNPSSNELISINNLSTGTIDQLYFSLRFGIINSITTDSIPLILDDCFTQYDNNRLRNILELLIDISKNRQIILFSCHSREGDILRKLKTNFNVIELS